MKNSKYVLIIIVIIGLSAAIGLQTSVVQNWMKLADHQTLETPPDVAQNVIPPITDNSVTAPSAEGSDQTLSMPTSEAMKKMNSALPDIARNQKLGRPPYQDNPAEKMEKEPRIRERKMGPLPVEKIVDHAVEENDDPEAPLRHLAEAKSDEKEASAKDDTSLPKSDFVRETDSRVFAFLNTSGDSPLKVDLFFERSPESVTTFVRDILKCTRVHSSSGCQRRTIGLDADTDAEIRATSKADPHRGIASVLSMPGYRGFICAYIPEDGGTASYTIALNVKDDVPENCHIIGGIVDAGDLEHRMQNELSTHVKYRYGDTSFSSEAHDETSKEVSVRYQKVTSLLGTESK